MNLDKHKHMLKVEKFESLTFALDYIRNIRELIGEVREDDFIEILLRVYDNGYAAGRRDVLDRTISSMYQEIDEIENEQ